MAAQVAARAGVPCNIITGPLGAGKSTAILHLLKTRGDGRWAVLVNEMGDVGLDGAIATSGTELVSEVAGGCICCANGVAVRVALTKLLRRKPSRLLVEPSGLGHVATLADVLQRPPLAGAVDLRAVVCVVSCDRHAKLWAAAPVYRDMVHAADVLVLNRRDVDAAAADAAETWARELFPPKHVVRGARGAFDVDVLERARAAPPFDAEAEDSDDDDRPRRTWTHVDGTKRVESRDDDHAYLGAVFSRNGAAFDGARLEAAIAAATGSPGAVRFKGVFFVRHRGWALVQWVGGDAAPQSDVLAWAADARYQLIVSGILGPVDVARLEQGFMDARIPGTTSAAAAAA